MTKKIYTVTLRGTATEVWKVRADSEQNAQAKAFAELGMLKSWAWDYEPSVTVEEE